jgi:hypothetical protein
MDGHLEGVETTLVVQMFGAPSTKKAEVSKTAGTVVFAAGIPTLNPTPQPTPASVAPELTKDEADFISGTRTYISPVQLSKAIALAIIFVLIIVLTHDMFVAHKKKTVRLTGKNIAHIALFSVIAVAIVLFRGGLLS